MSKTIKYLISLAGFVLAVLFIFLLILTVTAYRPPEILELDVLSGNDKGETSVSENISVLTWNIGYAGLGSSMDFALDGGKMGRPETRSIVEENLHGILKTLKTYDTDIVFLQEVDKDSRRSYGIDEVEMVTSLKPNLDAWFAENYNVKYIPYPLNSPLGSVQSGLLTLSRFKADNSQRLQLPGQYSWPSRLFYPVRCANLIRVPSESEGKDWCFINIHLSAYDKGGTLRIQQLNYIKDLMFQLYNEGNYVIVGGDWNSMFPGVNLDSFGKYTTGEEDLFWIQSIPSDWTPEEWQWATDLSTPSCRSLEKPYVEGENIRVLIDGFLLSPNIQKFSVKGLDLNFESSDHNPVLLNVQAK